jgi:hypothetical protein
VEAQVEAVLPTIIEDIPVNFQLCDVSKEIRFLKLGKGCGFDGIPNYFPQHLPRRTLVHLINLFNHSLRLGHFPIPSKEAKIITLPKPSKAPKFPKNVRPTSVLSTTDKLFQKLIFKTIEKRH